MMSNNSVSIASSGITTNPRQRLGQDVDVGAIVHKIAQFYSLGAVHKFTDINVGYEDCNLIIYTDYGKYVAKLFAQTRTIREIKRYTTIMSKITESGVRHPELIAGKNGVYALKHGKAWAVLAKFIEGKTFYELGRAPDELEGQEVLRQLVKLNNIDYSPYYIPNSWTMTKFNDMLLQVNSHLTPEDVAVLGEAYRRYTAMPINRFSRAFIHGDIRTTNVLLGDDGNIYLLDYFLANNHLRIHELAVAIVALYYDQASAKSLDEVCRTISDEYGQLLDDELIYLPDYVLSVFAVEFLGATYARYTQGNQTSENTYWLERGRSGLRKYIAE